MALAEGIEEFSGYFAGIEAGGPGAGGKRGVVDAEFPRGGGELEVAAAPLEEAGVDGGRGLGDLEGSVSKLPE